MRSRHGMTLFEIGLSLVILSVAVLSMAMIFPVGIKAQQLARFQLYAGALVTQMMDSWTNADHSGWRVQVESEQLGQNTFMSMPVDFERMLDQNAMGMLPLPNDISRRLDSDNDEIARIVQEGGQIYYTSPLPAEIGFDSAYYGTGMGGIYTVPPETQKLLFAVVGYAQQNALPSHPCLAWPYYDWYPSPIQPWQLESWRLNGWANYDEVKQMADRVSGENYDGISYDTAVDYLSRAKALVAMVVSGSELNMTANGPVAAPPPTLPAGSWAAGDPAVFPDPRKIMVLSWLANAALTQTANWMPAPTVEQENYAKQCHDACMQWLDRYVTTSRWDWGAPRPLNRQTAGDFPLLQYDLFPDGSSYPPPAPDNASPSAPYRDAITGDVCWKVIAELQPMHYGRARGEYGWLESPDERMGTIPDNHSAIDNSWGVHAHYNLTAPFQPAERIRQVVCWAVDWQSYEDFETAPAQELDANRHFIDSRGAAVSSEFKGTPPEGVLLWNENRTGRWVDNTGPVAWPDYGMVRNYRPEVQDEPYRKQWLGIFGADRNGNTVLDHGPVPKSARLRATTVARYNYYDRRFISSIRD